MSDSIDPRDCGAKIFLCRECVRCLLVRLDRAEKAARHTEGNVWYSRDPEEGVDFHATPEEAQNAAEASLDHFRDKSSEGWHEDIEGVEWGMVVPYQSAMQVNRKEAGPGSEFDYVCDYQLVTIR